MRLDEVLDVRDMDTRELQECQSGSWVDARDALPTSIDFGVQIGYLPSLSCCTNS
jgi:hypothetical protein